MIETNEKTKEKDKIKKNEIIHNESIRNADKKSTLSLSETPNILNEIAQYYGQSKNEVFSIFNIDDKSSQNGISNQTKLKNSFIDQTISHNKEESRSSLEEIRTLIQDTIEENKSKGKKEKKHKTLSKKKNNIIELCPKIKEKEKEKDNKNVKKSYSIKKRISNNFFDEDKNKRPKIEFRKSERIRTFKKDGIVVEDVERKKRKRKSLFSQQGISPNKIYRNNIYKKFFTKKNSFELKEEKRNEDKIYINIQNKEELVITVNTTQETVKNYYNNMEDCFEIIDLYFNKTIKLEPMEPVNFHFKENKKIVIFELESTLVSGFGETLSNEINNTIEINIRPHLKSSLDLIQKDYNIVIYSSSNKVYVDKILDFLDPNHSYFNYRLYQEHCSKFKINDKICFTKNLNIFKNISSLKDIIIVDCSVLGFGFFLENGIPIIPFYDSKEDVELKILSYYLVSVSSNYDLREALKRDMKLNDYLEKEKKKNEKKNLSTQKNEDHDKGENRKKRKHKESKEINIKSYNPSPEGIKRKIKNKTCKNNYIQIFKGSSDSEDDKKSTDNKQKNLDKTKKNKKDKDKDKIRLRKERFFSTKLIKNKRRKYTTNELNRNFNIKSPKKSSPGKTIRNSGKKNNDKNKKFLNDE